MCEPEECVDVFHSQHPTKTVNPLFQLITFDVLIINN